MELLLDVGMDCNIPPRSTGSMSHDSRERRLTCRVAQGRLLSERHPLRPVSTSPKKTQLGINHDILSSFDQECNHSSVSFGTGCHGQQDPRIFNDLISSSSSSRIRVSIMCK